MSDMFNGCSSLVSLDLSSLDTSSVTNMNQMFSGCSSLASLDLSHLDTSKVTDMCNMFRECSSLTSLDLSSLDTSKVTDMKWMFCLCSSLTSLDLSSFDTSSVTDMGDMFSGCSSLASLDLSSFDTSSVTYMCDMFSGCSSLASLDLSHLGTSKVTDMGAMFRECSSLTSLDLSSFDTSSVTDMGGMFYDYRHNLNCIAIPKDFKPKNELPKECKGLPITWETADGISLSTTETNAAGIYYAKVNIQKSYFNVDTENCGYTGKAIEKKIEPTEDYLQLKKVIKGIDYQIGYENNTDAGTATITIKGIGLMKGQLSYTFTINKANPSFEVPAGLTATCGQKLSDVQLPERFSWDSPDTTINWRGSKVQTVSYTPEDTKNYKVVSGIKVEVTASGNKITPPAIADLTFNGQNQAPTINVPEITIVKNKGGSSAGTYFIELALSDPYLNTWEDGTTENKTLKYKILPADISGADIADIKDANYTGEEVKPKPDVTFNGQKLVEGKDYTATYSDNTAVGTATVAISGEGNFTGTASATFKIAPADISGADIADIKDANYTGEEVKPKPDVTFNGQKLVEGKDYTATYSDNTAVGTATVAISGEGNFTGTASATFKIVTPTVQYDYDLEEGKLTSTSFPNSGFVDVKNFRITLDHGGMVYIHTYLLGIDDMLCSLQDANGKILHSWVPKDSTTYGAFALPAGTYYFQYFGSAEKNSFYNRASVMYTVRHHDEPLDTIYEKEPNDGAGEGHSIAADATPIEVGRFFAGSFYNPPIALDIDYFSFTLTKRSQICMNLVTEQSMMFALTDANGNILTNAQTGQSIVGKTDKGRGGGLNFGMLEPGTYYVMITSTSTGAVGSPYYGILNDVTSPVKTPAGLSRIAGNTRYSTMSSLVSAGNFASGGAAILASGTNYPDALAASSLAGDRNAPILLTDPNSLSEETKARLKIINPQILFIVGGEAAVSSKVEKSVEELLGESCTVIRLAGQTRYDTSLRVASLNSGRSDTVIIATGGNYADALSISPYAYASGSPVLLCDSKSGLSADAIAAISKGGYTKAVIVGGTAAVPQKVESQLRSAGAGKITRLAGSTRYETSAKIADFELSSGLGFTMDGLLLATGRNFPDALAAGPLAGRGPSPLLLVDPGASYACSYLGGHRNEISRVTVVGGNAAIPDSDAQKIAQTLQIQMVR